MNNFSLFNFSGAERFRGRVAAVVASAFCLLLFAGAVGAQEYKELNVDDSLAASKDATFSGGDAGAVQKLLTNYYIARWTVRANAREIHKYREELVADGAKLTGAAQKTFMTATIERLKKIAGAKSIYPACRFNAALAIASLDETPAPDRSNPGKPYAPAIDSLLELCGVAENQEKDDYPDYVRLAGLIGLSRHAELGIEDDATRAKVREAFIAILDPNYATEKKLRADVYDWFEAKALEGLTNFKSPEGSGGPNGTLDLFKSIVDDPKQDFELRCLAARGIGEMNLDAAKDFDYIALATSLTTMARDLCVEESSYIDSELMRDQIKSSASAGTGMGGGMGGMGSGGMGSGGMGSGMMGGGMMGGGTMGGGAMGSQNPKTLETIVARIQYGFGAVRAAIKGADNKSGVSAKLTADDEQTKEAAEMLKKVVEQIDSTNDFVVDGPETGTGGMMGGMGSGGMGSGGMGSGMMGANMAMGGKKTKKGAQINVDAASMKTHLLEKKIEFNRLLGVDSY